MENKQTLKALFESGKENLCKELQTLELPRDAKRVETVVKDYLNSLFDSNGDFRQGLTQSEDFVMQAAIKLLQAQQNMVGEFTNNGWSDNQVKDNTETSDNTKTQVGIKREQMPITLGGTVVGGAAGAIVLGSWGAVFGAIAGTALVFYYIMNQNSKQPDLVGNSKPATEPRNQKLDVDKFTKIIANICASVDELIETFRSQISKVVKQYENQPKPTLEANFAAFLDGIQSLVGYSRTHSSDEEKYVAKVQQRIEDVAELLENYDLELVNYDGNNASLFEEVESGNIQTPKMVFPAITKKGETIRKGKIFIPKK